jgi:hypothetical protein
MPAIGVMLVGVVVLYSLKVGYMTRQPTVELIACIDVEPAWMSWTCKEVLFHHAMSQSDLNKLNSHAGMLYAVSISKKSEAEAILAFLGSAGVDINAKDVSARGRTALHSTVAAGDAWATTLLLEHGAKIDVADDGGVTPLGLAQALVSQHPDRPEYRAVLDALNRAVKLRSLGRTDIAAARGYTRALSALQTARHTS